MYDPIRIPFNGESYVCASHFRDANIRNHIEKHGHNSLCSYCGAKAKVMDFADFMEYAADVIGKYYTTVDNADLPLESSFYDEDDDAYSIPGYIRIGSFVFRSEILPMEVPGLLEELDLTTDNDSLNDSIVECFDSAQEWVLRDPLSITTDEENSLDWEHFCETIKHKRRFSIEDEIIKDEFIGYTKSISDIIDRIFSIVIQNRCLLTLYAGTRLYRGRPFYNGETPDGFNSLTAPPDESAKQNRMSPAGISMFYGALSRPTAIDEIGSSKGTIYVGRFTTKRDLRLLDLTHLPRPSYWGTSDIGDMSFLRRFAKEVSKPIERDDRIHTEYIPTQAFTEYVRYRFKEDGNPIDGIMYGSSLRPGEINVVLFCNQKKSAEWLELTDYKEHV